ncbi:MAG TPA: hypothetical protein VML50_17820 [Anaeromyxobacter sp.]|nr:hypothetical protein [Anaeromyxobacter sp.]
MRQTPLLAAALLVAGAVARADTVEVTSTTMVNAEQQTRGGAAGQKLDTVTVVPAYEIVTITARDVKSSFADDLRLVVSGWGSWDLTSDHRWDNGTSQAGTGDLGTAYVQGQVFARHLQLRLGREAVMTGVGRMLQIDGGEAIAYLGAGLKVSGYAGAPVSQRFQSRGTEVSWNPTGGDLAYGGRVGWSFVLPGFPGRGFDLGVSANMVQNGTKDPVRQEAGADARILLLENLTLSGFGAYSIYDQRISEGTVAATWAALRKLRLTADFRFVEPGLLLARNSILSVFSASTRKEVGGGVEYEFSRGLTGGADYHMIVEPGAVYGKSFYYGGDGAARLIWTKATTQAGAELDVVEAYDNGYFGGRLFGKRTFGKFFAAADVLTHFYREKVNGQTYDLTGTLTAGYDLARGFAAVISGGAGVTPYFEQTFSIMAKLVYNQTYSTKEVR